MDKAFEMDHILERRGGEMWEDLRKWLREHWESGDMDINTVSFIEQKMKEIEKEYGVD